MDIDMNRLPSPSLETRRELTLLVNVPRTYVHLVLPRWSAQRKEIATAVMLRAGSHLFALTANHCVQSRQELRLLFPLGEGQKTSSAILKEIKREPLDIAVLELEDRTDVLACDIEQVCIDLPKPATKDTDPATVPLLWVIGFPAELAQATDTALSAPKVAFATNLVAVKPDTFALYYHEEAYGIGQDLTCENSRLPETPRGFSGAGVWGVDRPGEGTLFNPQKHVRLYGIQHAWLPQSRLLKCVPSRIVVEMLIEHYPDLNSRLLSLFPTLNDGSRRATLEDLYRTPGKAELIGGRIVEYMATGIRPSEVASNIYVSLRAYSHQTSRGRAFNDNLGFAIPELPSGRESFCPDASYYSGSLPTNLMRFVEGPPTFAVEVRSENDYGDAAEAQMATKRADYFAAGTLVVWDVDPVAETVTCYRSATPDQPVVFGRGQVADAEPAVPGWRMDVADVFA